jgi:dihydropteroate synthase
VSNVASALAAALAYAHEQGIPKESCVIDPGLGFSKTAADNIALLQNLGRLTALAPVLIGASRKRFIGELCGEPAPGARLGGSIAAAVWSVLHGASIVRVHDVKETVEALRMVASIR